MVADLRISYWNNFYFVFKYRPGISFGAADMHIHSRELVTRMTSKTYVLHCRYSWQYTVQSNVIMFRQLSVNVSIVYVIKHL